MRRLGLSATLVCGILIVATHDALGAARVHLSWDACPSALDDIEVAPGDGCRIALWVTGQEEPQRGYAARLVLVAGSGAFPDAWRFDEGGCQPEGMVAIYPFGPPTPTTGCRSLFSGGANPSWAAQFSYDPLDSHAYIDVTVDYGSVSGAPNPTSSYWLIHAIFDHFYSAAGSSGSGTCGGVTESICVRMQHGYYVSEDGSHVDWSSEDDILHSGLVGSSQACSAVPARATTWGTIKSQYRN